jgi:hypothetical protein
MDPPMDADHQSIEANADLTYGVNGGFFTPFFKSCPPAAICDSHPSPRQKKARVSHGRDHASEKDCNLLCDPETADKFIALLAESPFGDSPCQYRGNISPSLDSRWLKILSGDTEAAGRAGVAQDERQRLFLFHSLGPGLRQLSGLIDTSRNPEPRMCGSS